MSGPAGVLTVGSVKFDAQHLFLREPTKVSDFIAERRNNLVEPSLLQTGAREPHQEVRCTKRRVVRPQRAGIITHEVWKIEWLYREIDMTIQDGPGKRSDGLPTEPQCLFEHVFERSSFNRGGHNKPLPTFLHSVQGLMSEGVKEVRTAGRSFASSCTLLRIAPSVNNTSHNNRL